MVNIVLMNKKPKSESLLCAGLVTETLASRKVVWNDPCTEVSGTANTFIDKQELHMRHSQRDE